MAKKYSLFISHSLSYSDSYEKLLNIIDGQGLGYYEHSVSKDDPIHTRNGTLKRRKY